MRCALPITVGSSVPCCVAAPFQASSNSIRACELGGGLLRSASIASAVLRCSLLHCSISTLSTLSAALLTSHAPAAARLDPRRTQWPKLLRLAHPSLSRARFSTRRLPSDTTPPALQIAPAQIVPTVRPPLLHASPSPSDRPVQPFLAPQPASCLPPPPHCLRPGPSTLASTQPAPSQRDNGGPCDPISQGAPPTQDTPPLLELVTDCTAVRRDR